MSSLSDALSDSRTEQKRKAARALLRRPLLRANGPDSEAFSLVRRYAGELRTWFDRNTDWLLLVDSEVGRLVKTVPRTDDDTYPARDVRSGQPFGRRRYVLACLAMAVLERADTQVTLGRLAENVMLAATDPDLVDAGFGFQLDTRDQRADLVSVVRLLLDLGVLSRVAGDEDAFVKDTGDVLYDVNRRALATLIAAPRGPSTIEATHPADRLDALTEELEPTTDELRNRSIRHRLTRRLLDEPVLYFDELTAAEASYLSSQRAAITSRIAELTGLVPEVRAEGLAMVDPADDLTDVRMPETGTDGHVTLLLAEYLASRADVAVSVSELHEHVRKLAAEHRSFWRRNATEPGAEVELTEYALGRLKALRLIYRASETVLARPALARYAIVAPTVRGDKNGGRG